MAEEIKEDNSKVASQYEANLKKIVAIVGGQENIYPQKKINKDTVDTIVTELFKEQKEEFSKTFKNDLKELLSKKVQLDKDIRAKEEELKKLKETKQKEFNEACSKMFGKVEDLQNLEKDYYQTLTTVTSASSENKDNSNPLQ